MSDKIDISPDVVERLARALNALAFDAIQTDGWHAAASDIGQSRDVLRTLSDEITALRARLEAVEKERDELEGANILNRTAIRLQQARAERAEAALATARRDALEEAAAEAAGEVAAHGCAELAPFIRRCIRALANEAET